MKTGEIYLPFDLSRPIPIISYIYLMFMLTTMLNADYTCDYFSLLGDTNMCCFIFNNFREKFSRINVDFLIK